MLKQGKNVSDNGLTSWNEQGGRQADRSEEKVDFLRLKSSGQCFAFQCIWSRVSDLG